MGALSVVLFLSPISVLWVLLVYNIIPIVAMRSYKAFWSDTYKESRVHGLGKMESFFWTILQPAAICLGAWAGFYFGSIKPTFSFEETEQVSSMSIQASTPVSDALLEWCNEIE